MRRFLVAAMLPIATMILAAGCLLPSSGSDDSPGSRSSDATLSGLAISSGVMVPRFSPSVHDYTITVTDATESITITGNAASAKATVGDPNGKPRALAMGDNHLAIGVTAEDGSSASYDFTVVRKIDREAPVITDFTIEQASIDSTAADQRVTGTFTLEDCTGVNASWTARMEFIGPHGIVSAVIFPRGGGATTKVVYDWSLTVPRGSGRFTWTFSSIVAVGDTIDNHDIALLEDPSLRSSFEDTNASIPDTVKPAIVSVTVDKTSLAASTIEDQYVTYTLTLSDDKALGSHPITELIFDDPRAYIMGNPPAHTEIRSISADGQTEQVWEFIVTVPRDDGTGKTKGTYKLNMLLITDEAGNVKGYYDFNAFFTSSPYGRFSVN